MDGCAIRERLSRAIIESVDNSDDEGVRHRATVQDASEEEVETRTNRPMCDSRAIVESVHSSDDEEVIPQEPERNDDGYIHNESDFNMETSRDTGASIESANNSKDEDATSQSWRYCATVDDESMMSRSQERTWSGRNECAIIL
jgi:hypothetical protein